LTRNHEAAPVSGGFLAMTSATQSCQVAPTAPANRSISCQKSDSSLMVVLRQSPVCRLILMCRKCV
jgi:hypothetical protein